MDDALNLAKAGLLDYGTALRQGGQSEDRPPIGHFYFYLLFWASDLHSQSENHISIA
jgi:hypothetical protein